MQNISLSFSRPCNSRSGVTCVLKVVSASAISLYIATQYCKRVPLIDRVFHFEHKYFPGHFLPPQILGSFRRISFQTSSSLDPILDHGVYQLHLAGGHRFVLPFYCNLSISPSELSISFNLRFREMPYLAPLDFSVILLNNRVAYPLSVSDVHAFI